MLCLLQAMIRGRKDRLQLSRAFETPVTILQSLFRGLAARRVIAKKREYEALVSTSASQVVTESWNRLSNCALKLVFSELMVKSAEEIDTFMNMHESARKEASKAKKALVKLTQRSVELEQRAEILTKRERELAERRAALNAKVLRSVAGLQAVLRGKLSRQKLQQELSAEQQKHLAKRETTKLEVKAVLTIEGEADLAAETKQKQDENDAQRRQTKFEQTRSIQVETIEGEMIRKMEEQIADEAVEAAYPDKRKANEEKLQMKQVLVQQEETAKDEIMRKFEAELAAQIAEAEKRERLMQLEKSAILVCQVMYAFESQEPGDLNLRQGDTIYVMDRSDTGWWHGKNEHGQEGLFPANYVTQIKAGEEIKQEDDHDDDDDDDEPVPQLRILNVSPLEPSTTSVAHNQRLEKAREVAVLTCQVVHAFEAQVAGDLSLRVGETVYVMDRSEPTGWWRGMSQTGQEGIFPSTYVIEIPTIMSAEESAERARHEEEAAISAEIEMQHEHLSLLSDLIATQRAARKRNQGYIVVAIADWIEALEPGELSLRTGDLVMVTEEISPDWLIGNRVRIHRTHMKPVQLTERDSYRGSPLATDFPLRGIFPARYVRLLEIDDYMTNTDISEWADYPDELPFLQVKRRFALAHASYKTPADETELPIEKGEILEVKRKVRSYYLVHRPSSGEEGLVPATFLTQLARSDPLQSQQLNELEDMLNSVEIKLLMKKKLSAETQQKKAMKELKKAFAAAVDADTSDLKSLTVLREWSSSDTDGVSVKIGEQVTVLKTGDNWFCIRKADGSTGVCPPSCFETHMLFDMPNEPSHQPDFEHFLVAVTQAWSPEHAKDANMESEPGCKWLTIRPGDVIKVEMRFKSQEAQVWVGQVTIGASGHTVEGCFPSSCCALLENADML